MANSLISSTKYKIEEIEIMIQAIEQGYIRGTTKRVAQQRINFLKRQQRTDYIMDLIARLTIIKRRCKQ